MLEWNMSDTDALFNIDLAYRNGELLASRAPRLAATVSRYGLPPPPRSPRFLQQLPVRRCDHGRSKNNPGLG